MKVRIDTKLKTIAIDEPIALDELVKFVKALFPDDWKEWKLDTNVKIEVQSTPIWVDRYPAYPWGPYWYAPYPNLYVSGGTVLTGDSTTNVDTNGTFTVHDHAQGGYSGSPILPNTSTFYLETRN